MALDVPVVVDGAGVCLNYCSTCVAAVGEVIPGAAVVAEVAVRQIAPALGAALVVVGVH